MPELKEFKADAKLITNPGPQSGYSIISPSPQKASDFFAAVRKTDPDQRLWLDPVTQDRRRIMFDKDQSLEHMNSTGRCSLVYAATIEAFKQAVKWSDEMVTGLRPGVLVCKVRLLNIDRRGCFLRRGSRQEPY